MQANVAGAWLSPYRRHAPSRRWGSGVADVKLGAGGGLDPLRRGTPAYRRVMAAMVAAAFATFALLYCVQPLMPVFTDAFAVPPSVASISLSVATGTLACGLLIAGRLSDAIGRKGIMATSLFIVSSMTLVCAAAPSWGVLIVVRALVGLAMAGVPAIGMAYLAEELHPRDMGAAMGLYIAGNAFGGLIGRLLTGLLLDWSGSWRVAMGFMGCFGFVSACLFVVALPPSRRFVADREISLARLADAYARHVREPGLRLLFGCGFLLMGGFVTVYNYASYRLLAPPFDLSAAAASTVFAAYLLGGPASAWFGRIGGRYGRGRVMLIAMTIMACGVLLTLPNTLVTLVGGICILTVGYFGAHSIASSWVTKRASTARAQAASLYLFCYYVGSSVVGSTGGLFWSRAGWPGLVALICVLLALALLSARRLGRLEHEEGFEPSGSL